MTALIKGREQEPVVQIVYGEAGAGKTSYALGAPTPVFVGPERNKEVNGLKFPRTETQEQLLSYLKEIETGKHDKAQIRTVVLDAITTQEGVIRDGILKKEPGKTMQTACGGYGKANDESLRQLVEVRDALQAITEKKEMNIIVLAHCIKNNFNDPLLMTNYDSYEIALHKGKNKEHAKVFIEWASSVLFLHWKQFATEDKKHATGIGKRVIRTECRPSHVAKNRYNLPETIQMLDDAALLKAGQTPQTFNLVMQYINEFYASGAQANTMQNDFNMLVQETKGLIDLVKDENTRPAIIQSVTTEINNGNYANLMVLRDRLKEIVEHQ
jgi:hypothetical protein